MGGSAQDSSNTICCPCFVIYDDNDSDWFCVALSPPSLIPAAIFSALVPGGTISQDCQGLGENTHHTD